MLKKSLTDRLVLLSLMILAMAIMWDPDYLHQQLNLFEWGLYLPGIDAVSQGQVPYRDFLHLRGPFELYAPALFMKTFGFRADVLAGYFYFGTVLTVLASVLIAFELIGQRFLLYSFVLIVVTRTFPWVVFTFWGGMRYAWGLLALWTLVKFFKSDRRGWLAAAGCLAAISAWTSVEIGASVVIAFLVVATMSRQVRSKSWLFFAGFLSISVPYGIYLLSQHAFMPYLQDQWTVVTHNGKTFLEVYPVPDTIAKLVHAVFVPGDINFHQMTPMYCYAGFLGYYAWRLNRREATVLDHAVLAVAVYGLMIFASGFRSLWASVFEMSLQPEKIVLFYLLGQAIVRAQQQFSRIKWVGLLLLAGVFMSSMIFSIGHFDRKFYKFSWGYRLISGKHVKKTHEPESVIDLPRIRHMTIPQWQAEDIEQLKTFVDAHVPEHEKIWMYPELGSMYFLVNRPWVGRFPQATLSWEDEDWFADYEKALESDPPKFAVVDKVIPFYFDSIYFLVPANRAKHERMMLFLHDHYAVTGQTPTYFIYQRIH